LDGALLAYWANQDAKGQKSSLKKAILKGSFIGALTGFCIIYYIWALWRGLYGEAEIYLPRTLLAALMSFFAGGLTGSQLYYLHQKSRVIKAIENFFIRSKK
jgi:hypothetical protein